MTQPRGLAVLVVGLVWLAPAPARAQEDTLDLELDRAKTQYRDGRFAEAITTLQGAVIELGRRQDQQASRQRLADAHLLLGLSYFAMRDEPAAMEQFRQVIAIDAARALDPEIYSPRVIGMFERARSETASGGPLESQILDPAPTGLSTSLAPRSFGEGGVAPGTPGAPLLPSGTRVRVTLRGASGGVTGHLSDLNERAVTLIGRDNLRLSFPREMVTRMEVVRGRKSHWRMGLLIGGGSGLAVGAVITPDCTPEGLCDSRADTVAAYTFGLGLIGGLLGAAIKTDQWTDVSSDRVALGISPAGRGGVRVAMAWRF